MVKQVPIGNAPGVILVDDEDFDNVSAFRWTLKPEGYVWRSVHGGRRHVYLHRQLLGLTWGDKREADHKNRNRLDNRRTNLRILTQAKNRQNTPALGGLSPYRGVTYDSARAKWVAQAQMDRRHYFLGRYESESEAAEAAFAWRRKNMPYAED